MGGCLSSNHACSVFGGLRIKLTKDRLAREKANSDPLKMEVHRKGQIEFGARVPSERRGGKGEGKTCVSRERPVGPPENARS